MPSHTPSERAKKRGRRARVLGGSRGVSNLDRRAKAFGKK